MASEAVVPQEKKVSLRTLSAVPAEVWQQILSDINDKTLRAVVLARCPASPQAVRLLWKDITPENGKLTTLYHNIEHNQQSLANHVQSITMLFEAPGEQLPTCSLMFPTLQRLRIVHNKKHKDVFTNTHAHIKTLLGPALTLLEIGSEDHEGSDAKPRVDNFLSTLKQCVNLHTLSIRACVQGSPAQFVQALRDCGNLKNLTLDKHTAPLVTPFAFKAIGSHPKLASLKVNKVVDMTLVSPISGLNAPFPSLSSLDLIIEADAVLTLLPDIQNLRSLRLVVIGTTSIFPAFSNLATLERLELQFDKFSLTRKDYTQLTFLVHLTHLELDGHAEDGSGLNTDMIDGISLANVLSQLPALQLFHLSANNTFDDEFLVALGRGCPKLTSLSFSGSFELVALCPESGVVFPQLLDLQISNVTSVNPWMDEVEEYELAADIADAVRKHAPRLSTFHSTSKERPFHTMLAYKVGGAWRQKTTRLSLLDGAQE
ncbi:hypothetical protein QM012_005560 [Aureobasidium pullulans]|uniref:F-box domain-containing protein n=1 Tax=Aureobasidium pullulans TaxID=5580 RepID=A0ABR0T4L4_AURPU